LAFVLLEKDRMNYISSANKCVVTGIPLLFAILSVGPHLMSCVTITRDISVSAVGTAGLTNYAGYTLYLPMAFAAESHLAKGQFRRLKSTLTL
jgi:hypothetical protein